MSSWLVDPATRALTSALDGYAKREQAIASNLANVDTPGYQSLSTDFEGELAAAVADGAQGPGGALNPPTYGPSAALGPARTAASHLAGLAAGPDAAFTPPVGSTAAAQAHRLDGNAVDVDAQMTSLAETQLKYAAVSRMLSGKLQQLKDVVSAR